MTKVTRLTEEQTAKMAEYRDAWIRIGLSTEPANRAEAERAIAMIYAAAGKPAPEKIIWCGSPLSQGLTRAIVLGLKGDIGKKVWASVRASVWASVWDSVRASVGASVRDSVGASVGDSVWDSVRASVWASVGASVRDSVRASVWASVGASVGASVRDSVRASVGASVRDSVRASVWDSVRASVWASVGASVRDSVRASVWDSVRASVGASVRDSVRASVWDSVRASVWASVGASVRDSVWASVGASVWDSGYGQHDANWLAFYEYFRNECGLVEQTERLQGLTLLARHAGWFLPHEKICWVSERHSVLHRDEQGRLHCEDGPALGYPDKFQIWAWHGTRVPCHVIEAPESITIEQIRTEQNAEVRRVMIQRMGWERFCSAAKMRVIHTDRLQTNFPALPVSETVHADMRAVTTYRAGEEVAELLESEEFTDFDNRPLKFVRVTDPSTDEQYLLRVWPENRRAYEAIGQTFGMSEEAYKHSVYLRQGDVGVIPLAPVTNLQQQHS